MNIEEKIKEVCPIYGISMANATDKTTWRIDFKPEATNKQKKDARDLIDKYTVKTFDQEREENEKDIDKIDIKIKAVLLLIADLTGKPRSEIKEMYSSKIKKIQSKQE